MTALVSRVVQYTGGDTRLGHRVRIVAAVTLLTITLRTVVVVGVRGSGCCSKKKKRSAIQEDLRKVGKAVAGDTAVESEDFDDYDVVIVGGGMYAQYTTGCDLGDLGHELRSGICRYRWLRSGVAPQRRAYSTRPVTGSWWKVHNRATIYHSCTRTLTAFLSASENPLVRTPSGFSLLPGTSLVFNLFTTPQQGSGDRARHWPRGEHAFVSLM